MFFTNLGRIVAVLALVGGILSIAIGLIIATEALLPYEEALRRYAPGASSSGAVIDKGTRTIIFAIALGILTEIRSALRQSS